MYQIRVLLPEYIKNSQLNDENKYPIKKMAKKIHTWLTH